MSWKRFTPLVGAATVLALVAIVPALAATFGPPASKSPPTSVEHVYTQHVLLTGQAEKPRGELDGSGGVTICINKDTNTVSFNFDALLVRGQPTVAHIEKGAVGVAGPVAVGFTQPGMIDPTIGEIEWNDTVPASASTVTALIGTPKNFYVNVHTKAYPSGAVRGQLAGWKKLTLQEGVADECSAG